MKTMYFEIIARDGNANFFQLNHKWTLFTVRCYWL